MLYIHIHIRLWILQRDSKAQNKGWDPYVYVAFWAPKNCSRALATD